MSDGYDYLFKLLLIGDAGTGKSNILMRYTENSFTTSYISTIGVDFRIKSVQDGAATTKLQIWDTAGQERFRTITSSYYRGASGIFIVYDVTDRQSFENVETWRQEISKYSSEIVKVFVIGNKCDNFSRQVSTEEASAYCSSLGLPFFEVSAQSGHQVEEAFMAMASALRLNADVPESSISHDMISPYQEPSYPQPTPSPQSIEDGINILTGLIATKVLPTQQNELSPEATSFQEMIAHKPTSWKLNLAVGEFEQPKCNVSVRYKSSSEASALGYELGAEHDSIAIGISFKADDYADSFRLGELSSALKLFLDPLLSSSKTSLSTKVVSEFDGTKILRFVWEVKDQALVDTIRQVLSLSEATKFDVDMEFSERPTRNPPSEFLFMRLNMDTEFKRIFHSLGGRSFADIMSSRSKDSIIFLSFFTTMRRVAFSLEFDSWAEFWSTVIGNPSNNPPPEWQKPGWFSLAKVVEEFLGKNSFAGDSREQVMGIYKNFEGLAGLHQISLVVGNQYAVDVKCENFDIFTLLPTFSELEELQRKARGEETNFLN